MSLERLNGLGVADVVDAMGMAFQHRAHIIHLDSPDPDRVLFGPAVTIGFLPVRKDLMDPERHSLGPAFYRAIGDDDPAGKVLVMASNGHPHASLGGGTKLSRLQNHKLGGLLCDGTVRDFEELETYDFAVYCKGETARAGGNEIQPYLTDVPVCVDGVTIVPGDYIFAKGSTGRERGGRMAAALGDTPEPSEETRQGVLESLENLVPNAMGRMIPVVSLLKKMMPEPHNPSTPVPGQ